MILKKGINASSSSFLEHYNKDIYKLDATDPLKYKWSLLSKFHNSSDYLSHYTSPATPTIVYPIITEGSGSSSTTSFNSFRLKTRWVVTIIVVLICGLIFVMYKIKKYKIKKKYTYQQNISESSS